MAHISRDHQDFHVGLKAFLEKDKKLLILQDNDGFWELPGGRIEKREIYKDLKIILAREVGEELGKDVKYEIGSIFHNWIRKPNKDKDFTIFLVGFLCIFKEGEITLSKEHKNFRWISKSEAKKLKFENTYKKAVEYYFKNNL